MNDDLRYYGNPMNWESTKGDLISRETLLDKFDTKCQSICPTCEYNKWNSKLKRYECELISTAPTVSFTISPDYVTKLQNHNKELIKQLEEVERPEGEWIIDGHHRRCKNCGEYFCMADSEGNEIPSNFCPNCGADMRKGSAE